jgi:hypothetical protein
MASRLGVLRRRGGFVRGSDQTLTEMLSAVKSKTVILVHDFPFRPASYGDAAGHIEDLDTLLSTTEY